MRRLFALLAIATTALTPGCDSGPPPATKVQQDKQQMLSPTDTSKIPPEVRAKMAGKGGGTAPR
jgi:hypothetical protein